ncbi:MAG: 16S rRNA (adenine(1518)-N(6)/adenine(1519)-N(6))-dimethyltransferase RsmA [Acidimicrobiia bacterium]|nr:16S rRNA (adenine(1518)-N(6)/adenine(1519)-N(6))-dimethyltransferase RsmA [Acidimicrobiia bacterium]MYL08498.1 16S rRNA (adenine(1518)-N(6)/adenine(1519)-N(6))-dimethyltransferase RsmA [Acidimicrobiia bacterium]
MTLTRTQVLDLLDRHGLAPSRAMGQNFVVDPNTIDAMVRVAELAPNDSVVEIGPGLGSLTRALAAEVDHVLAVEADRHLLAPLAEVADAPNIEIVHADATTPEWRTKLGPRERRWALVANLPYNVAVPLLLDLLDNEPRIETFTFMVQKEVADRLVASVGTKAYGIPTLKVAYWCEARIVRAVPPTVFYPRPRVSSAVVRMERLPAPAVEADPDHLFSLVRTAFGQRRKMLRRSLSAHLNPEHFAQAAISPTARPEQLTLTDWAELAAVASS